MRSFLRLFAVLVCASACGESSSDDGTTSSVGTSSSGGSSVSSGTGGTSTMTVGGAGGAGGVLPTSPRFDALRQKAVHNSYERDEALFDQLAYHRVRALELDLHIGKWTWPEVSGDWYVFHENGPTLNETSCHRLSDCLDDLSQFQRAVPDHEIVTVFIDLKDDWATGGHRPEDLDALLDAGIGRENIFTPADLLANCPSATTLRGSVAAPCGFPEVDSLRGRWIFALTGGTLCGNTRLSDYAMNAEARRAFVAGSITDSCNFESHADKDAAVFFNGDFDQIDAAEKVHDAGLMMRIYSGGLGGGLDDQASWNAAKAKNAHFLATNKVNFEVDPWSRTHGATGYPFECIEGGACDVSARTEGSPPIGADVVSGDLGPSDDAGLFAEALLSGDLTLDAAISTRNSHVEPFAKGCLMARESTAPKSPFFAVCRPADANVVRVELRGVSGEATQVTDRDIVPNDSVDQDSVVWVRLQLIGVTARGYASLNGVDWTLIRTFSFPSLLTKRGIWASGHDNPEPVRFLFHGLTHEVNGQKVSLDFSAFGAPSFLKGALGSLHATPTW